MWDLVDVIQGFAQVFSQLVNGQTVAVATQECRGQMTDVNFEVAGDGHGHAGTICQTRPVMVSAVKCLFHTGSISLADYQSASAISP